MERRTSKTGLPPGSFVHIGEKKTNKVNITLYDYDEESIKHFSVNDFDEIFEFSKTTSNTWINITGLHDVELLEKINTGFDIHVLSIEDILNTEQRPKIEIFENYILIILKMVRYKNDKLQSEQISFILGKNLLLTFQEKEDDFFDPIRKRIENAHGRVRKFETDYLTYTLLDLIIDHYFEIMEKITEETELIEDTISSNPADDLVEKIHDLKRKIRFLRKTIYPVRDLVLVLKDGDSPLIAKPTLRYIHDLYDHTIQIIDAININREIMAATMDLYLSTLSIKMNEVMKVLTIIATVFIPLSFLAGVYGMNFNTDASFFNMPELNFRYGYLLFWVLVSLVGVGFFWFFKRKKWI